MTYRDALKKGIPTRLPKFAIQVILRFVGLDAAGLFSILWEDFYDFYGRETGASCYICGLHQKFWKVWGHITLLDYKFPYFKYCCSLKCQQWGDELEKMYEEKAKKDLMKLEM
jgi:hypothetical protein